MKNQNHKILRTVVSIRCLDESRIHEMFGLFEKYYDHVNLLRFTEDLKEKTHVFLFHELSTGRLIGFSTIFRKELPTISPGVFLFSGDTVIHEDYWGSKALQKSFFWFILKSKLLSPLAPVYWMLMSKGVKTYLMMRRNFKKSCPNHHGPTSPSLKHVIDAFYSMKFPGVYNPETGLIQFKEKCGSVKAPLIVSQEKELQDPESKFFFQINPHYLEGDELACVAEIRFSDFFHHLYKFFLPRIKS